jgi:hypothetical protein
MAEGFGEKTYRKKLKWKRGADGKLIIQHNLKEAG